MREFSELDAVAQAALVRSGEATALDLVTAAIERLELVNPDLNLVVTPMYDQALETARSMRPTGRLAGVPFLLKDLIASYAGVRLAEGSLFLHDHIAKQDSELVRRIKQAGLIVIGKTNTPEFGNASTTEPVLFGPSRNPWNADRTTGGSSGGSAAAVAVRVVPMAHGNDGGGSIRIPASCCGVFGLKPTRARNPLGPDFGDIFAGLYAEHALTLSVRDSAAFLDAVSGPELGDPYCAPAPPRSFFAEVGANPGKLKIAFTTDAPDGASVHSDCLEAVRDAATLCDELGHEVVEASPSFDTERTANAFFALWAEGNAWMVDSWSRRIGRKPRADELEPLTWALQEAGRARTAADHLLAVQELQRASRDMARFFVDYDLWLTPTLAEPPVPLGTFDPPTDDPLWSLKRDGEFSPFVWLANVTGQPAMSVPLSWNAEGLPIGTHFQGRVGSETTLFQLASQLEEARTWSTRWPPQPPL